MAGLDPKSQLDGADILRRIFEPMQAGWERVFEVGTKVRLKRPVLAGLPVGAEGVVKSIDPDNEKGKVLYVQFDVSPFRIPLDSRMRDLMMRAGTKAEDIPAYFGLTSTDVTPMDVERID